MLKLASVFGMNIWMSFLLANYIWIVFWVSLFVLTCNYIGCYSLNLLSALRCPRLLNALFSSRWFPISSVISSRAFGGFWIGSCRFFVLYFPSDFGMDLWLCMGFVFASCVLFYNGSLPCGEVWAYIIISCVECDFFRGHLPDDFTSPSDTFSFKSVAGIFFVFYEFTTVIRINLVDSLFLIWCIG